MTVAGSYRMLPADMLPPELTLPCCKRLLLARSWLWAAIGLVALWITVVAVAAPMRVPPGPPPPRPPREFRGVWIASVANLDWPSKPGLPTAEQKSELVAILDRAAQLRLNALMLQVRPACDALYPSNVEPWSEFLTGQMGKAPDPYYDPLGFAIEEAHRRGLELHAWFNPFRVRAPNPKTGAATNYITRTHPQFVRTYGSQLWLDPGLKPVQEYSTRIILDVVRKYDIDGVHLDDYFYPYPEKDAAGQYLDFPDQATWQQYRAGGGQFSREDWRRKNIDDFVESLYRKIKTEKPWVKLGISPFGLWRPGFPAQVKKGLDSYDALYADSRKWLVHGWVDYLAPQLYWAIDSEQSYPALLNWWASQNTKSRVLCPGNDASKVGRAWRANEILKQIRLTRKQTGASGNIFWGVGSLMSNNDRLAEALGKEFYGQPALLPAFPWLHHGAPAKPQLQFSPGQQTNSLRVSWTNSTSHDVRLWLYQTRIRGKWTLAILPGTQTAHPLPTRTSTWFPDLVAVTAVDRYGATGPTATVDVTKPLRAPAKPPSSTNNPALSKRVQ